MGANSRWGASANKYGNSYTHDPPGDGFSVAKSGTLHIFTLRMAVSVIAVFFLSPKYQQMKKRQEVF